MKPRGVIQYEEIKTLTLAQAWAEIKKVEKPLIKDLKMSDMVIGQNASELLLVHSNYHSVYGAGVYVFFDYNMPVYVGKAQNFRNRTFSHLSWDLRENWAWCEAKKLIARKKLNLEKIDQLTEEQKDVIHQTLISWGVLRINLYDPILNYTGYSKLETLIGGCCNSTLLNNHFVPPSEEILNTQLSKIVRQ